MMFCYSPVRVCVQLFSLLFDLGEKEYVEATSSLKFEYLVQHSVYVVGVFLPGRIAKATLLCVEGRVVLVSRRKTGKVSRDCLAKCLSRR